MAMSRSAPTHVEMSSPLATARPPGFLSTTAAPDLCRHAAINTRAKIIDHDQGTVTGEAQRGATNTAARTGDHNDTTFT